MVRLVIDNRIRICGEVPEEVLRDIAADFTYENPDYKRAKVFGFKGRIPKYITTWRRPTGDRSPVGEVLSVPRGGIQRVLKGLGQAGLVVEHVVDSRVGGAGIHKIPGSNLSMRGYQQRLIDYAMAVFNVRLGPGVALWRSPTASGKTTAALQLAACLQKKTLVIVATSVLLGQWLRRTQEDHGIEAGVIGGGKYRVNSQIVIAMQQSLKGVSDEELAQYGLVIGDEIQLFAAPTFEASVDRIPAMYRLGISGDERRSDHKEFLIYDQFGPVTCEVKQSELVDAGMIHEVEVRVVPTEFRSELWDKIEAIEAHPGESDDHLRIRKVQAKIRHAEELANDLGKDQSRTQLIVDLVRESITQTGQAIVLSTRREHCHIIDAALTAAGFRSGLLIGGPDYREIFEQTFRRFQSGETQVAVGTYQAIGVGFDLPIVARGICAAPAANGQDGSYQWRQYRGRFARTADGKLDAAIYYLLDVHVYGYKPLRHLMRWNSKVVVRDGDTWIPAKAWLAKERTDGETTKRRSTATTGFEQWDATAQHSSGGATSPEPKARRPRSSSGSGEYAASGAGLGIATGIEATGKVRERRKRSDVGRS